MQSPEYIVHGTSSETDAEGIKREGFEAQEGRATVSGDLSYALRWATEAERRQGSKSTTEVKPEDSGRIVVMETPKDVQVDYATHTDVDVDEASREVTGYSSKFVSGRRQLGLFREGDVVSRRRELEEAKSALKLVSGDLRATLRGAGIDYQEGDTNESLSRKMASLDLSTRARLLTQADRARQEISRLRKLAEEPIAIGREHVLMSIVPSEAFRREVDQFTSNVEKFESVDLNEVAERCASIILHEKENHVADNADVQGIVRRLLETTRESILVNLVRGLAMEVKRAKGYAIYNRGRSERKEVEVDPSELRRRIERFRTAVEPENSSRSSSALIEYVRRSLKSLESELNEEDVNLGST
jgi:hypothetical protein